METRGDRRVSNNRFTNRRRLEVRLNAIGKRTAKEVGRAVRRGALAIENRAAQGIIDPPKTGRIYPSKHRKGALHQASAPGEFPAADSGRLHQSITHAMTANGPENYRAEVAANAPHATFLEFGTSNMAPRPFMAPSFDEVRPAVEKNIRRAIQRGARGGR